MPEDTLFQMICWVDIYNKNHENIGVQTNVVSECIYGLANKQCNMVHGYGHLSQNVAYDKITE